MAAMKKYKICLGTCGPKVLYSNIIKAHTPEEAVQKYIDEQIVQAKINNADESLAELCGKMSESFSQEQFNELLKATKEYIPEVK